MSAAEQELLDHAREMVEEKASGSQIFDNEADKKIPRFDFVGKDHIMFPIFPTNVVLCETN